MLPNFRRAEPDVARPSPRLVANEPAPALPVRTQQPPAAPRAADRPAPSVIGAGLTINGNLVSQGELQIDGTVQGDIQGNHVIIGEHALITGNVYADEIVIRGRVAGAVRGKRVMLQANSQVEGDIFHQALSIEQGAMFEGKSRRTSAEALAAAAPKAASAAKPSPEPAAVKGPPQLS